MVYFHFVPHREFKRAIGMLSCPSNLFFAALLFLVWVGLFPIAAPSVAATTYLGPGTADGNGVNDGAGISSVVIGNTASNITFTINSSQPMTSYVLYTVEIQKAGQGGSGDASLNNPWGEHIGISTGVNSLINTWGTGASALTYSGTWTQNGSGSYDAGGTGSSFATKTFALSDLGLNVGDSFYFDVVSSYASPSGQAGYGALASTGYPAETDNSYQPWLGTNYYDSATDANSTFNSGATLYTVVPESFIVGADMSHLAFFESKGKVYKDGGVTTNALAILQKYGVTCVRLRLFTSSAAQAAADPYDYINNLDYTVPLAQRVKNAGLQFCLDFHYSDTWADPGHQSIPSSWTNLSFSALVQQMYSYNSNTIAAFRAAGAMPDYVQVGNEINSGMLWPYGEVGSPSNNWSQLAQLMNAAVQGIQAASAGTSMPKIIVHLGSGGDWGATEWFFDNLTAQGVPFDIIGLSYYPFWGGPLANLSNCLNNAANSYHKPVVVAETAFPWNNTYWTTSINGIMPSVTGQVQYVVALAPIVKGVSGGFGAGVFWWGTEYQAVNGVKEAGFNTASWFNTGGDVLPAAIEFGQLSAPLNLSIQLNSPNVQLNWPLSGAGLSLVTTTNLTAPVTWSPVTNAVQNTGTVFWVTEPMDSGPQRFYRLQSNW